MSTTHQVHTSLDVDGDGFGVGETETCARCETEDKCAEDCDDENPDVHPSAEETCNMRDDDCDGATDEGGVCQ